MKCAHDISPTPNFLLSPFTPNILMVFTIWSEAHSDYYHLAGSNTLGLTMFWNKKHYEIMARSHTRLYGLRMLPGTYLLTPHFQDPRRTTHAHCAPGVDEFGLRETSILLLRHFSLLISDYSHHNHHFSPEGSGIERYDSRSCRTPGVALRIYPPPSILSHATFISSPACAASPRHSFDAVPFSPCFHSWRSSSPGGKRQRLWKLLSALVVVERGQSPILITIKFYKTWKHLAK